MNTANVCIPAKLMITFLTGFTALCFEDSMDRQHSTFCRASASVISGHGASPTEVNCPSIWRCCRHVIRDPAGGGPVDPKVQDPVGSVNEGGAPLCSPEAVTDSTPHIGEAGSVHQEFRSLLGRVDAAG